MPVKISFLPSLLVGLTALTGLVWLVDRLWLKKKRAADSKSPWWMEYFGSLFPVFLVVVLLRSFLVDPFWIPSSSMEPTLLPGDFVLVNKYSYGIRLPVINKKIISVGEPKRGDVAVFRYPPDPSLDYIKRVIGLPGDTIEYTNKHLAINGVPVPEKELPDYLDRERALYSKQSQETFTEKNFTVIVNPLQPPSAIAADEDFPFRKNCEYNERGFKCQVPPGHYLVMGDNRDNSRDSRVWGFVPEGNLVGRAFLIWFSTKGLKRIGSFN